MQYRSMTSTGVQGGQDNTQPPNTMDPPQRLPMVRPGFGREGRRIPLLTNHFRVKYEAPDTVFYHYNVSIETDNKHVVTNTEVGRRVMDKLHETYRSELAGKTFAYDGQKSFFTVGQLPQNHFEFTVVLEESSARAHVDHESEGYTERNDRKRSKHLRMIKTFKVEIRYAAKVPFSSVVQALEGGGEGHPQDVLRILDIILRQQQAKRGCLLVRQSFFNAEHMNLVDVGGGVSGCRGFHSSFRTTQDGLSLNMDVTTTMVLTPGPVVDFLLNNQNVRDTRDIDWAKAKRMLKNMRIRALHRNKEFKITGLSEFPCKQQFFPIKVGEEEEGRVVETSVFDYFKSRNIELTWSADMPCLDVGRRGRPVYLPLELCHLVPLQRYTKALSSRQRAALVEKSRQKPRERIRVVTEAVKSNRYDQDPMLAACGIRVEGQLTQVDGRVLDAPTLKVGNSEDCWPRNGRWNFNHKRLFDAVKIDHWAIVNFSARCDLGHLSRALIDCGRNKGMHINRPSASVEEDRQWMRSAPVVRVERMIEMIKARLSNRPEFILCVLPERKNSDLYGPWKRKNLHELGIPTQCIAPTSKVNDQYLTNVLLKINAKLGGLNSLLSLEHTRSIPFINEEPTMILGMDVNHGPAGRSDVPSVAAVVGSRKWPLVSKYRASVRTQAPKVEMIEALYKPSPNGGDDGMIRELLIDFYQSTSCRKPSQMIIFRDGVSESQFSQVLDVELNQIIKAFEGLGESRPPKFTIIVAQKIHHTRLFQAGSPDNVPPGTVVDRSVVHPTNYDFYMCAQAGMIGTSRPTHYQVLLDEIGFSPDDLQKLVHSLSYVYQRSSTAVSVVAPVCYAHLAALQMSQFIKFEDHSETSSGPAAVPEMPRLNKLVSSSMFFC